MGCVVKVDIFIACMFQYWTSPEGFYLVSTNQDRLSLAFINKALGKNYQKKTKLRTGSSLQADWSSGKNRIAVDENRPFAKQPSAVMSYLNFAILFNISEHTAGVGYVAEKLRSVGDGLEAEQLAQLSGQKKFYSDSMNGIVVCLGLLLLGTVVAKLAK